MLKFRPGAYSSLFSPRRRRANVKCRHNSQSLGTQVTRTLCVAARVCLGVRRDEPLRLCALLALARLPASRLPAPIRTRGPPLRETRHSFLGSPPVVLGNRKRHHAVMVSGCPSPRPPPQYTGVCEPCGGLLRRGCGSRTRGRRGATRTCRRSPPRRHPGSPATG